MMCRLSSDSHRQVGGTSSHRPECAVLAREAIPCLIQMNQTIDYSKHSHEERRETQIRIIDKSSPVRFELPRLHPNIGGYF